MKKLILAVNTPAFFLSHRKYLAEHARQCGYDVYVLCPDGEETVEILRLGFKLKTFWIKRKSLNVINELKCFYSIFKAIREVQPDIYHGFTIKPVLYGIISSLILGVPNIIATITGLGSSFLAQGVKARFVKNVIGYMYKLCGLFPEVKFVFQNNDDKNLFVQNGWVQPESAVVILGTGVDTSVFKPAVNKSSKIRVVFPARFLRDKGIFELIEAGAHLYKNNQNFVIQLCGKTDAGNPTSVSQDLINEWSKLPFIEVLGFRKDMQSVYQSADIVCLPSYREGIPLALIEAASCAKPIVTTNTPGCREVVDDEDNGYLVEVGNSVDLADKLSLLINSELLRKRMSERSRIKALSLFDKKIVLAQNIELYSKEEAARQAA